MISLLRAVAFADFTHLRCIDLRDRLEGLGLDLHKSEMIKIDPDSSLDTQIYQFLNGDSLRPDIRIEPRQIICSKMLVSIFFGGAEVGRHLVLINQNDQMSEPHGHGSILIVAASLQDSERSEYFLVQQKAKWALRRQRLKAKSQLQVAQKMCFPAYRSSPSSARMKY